jgi:hypothetical protein
MRSQPSTRQSHRRAAGALAALAAAVALAGCGSPSPAKERSDIRGVITDFLGALGRGEAYTACAHATPAGQGQIVHVLGPELTNFGINGCLNVLYVIHKDMKRPLREILQTATVGRVQLHGDSATVRWSAVSSPRGELGSAIQQTHPIELTRTNGVWLLTKI